jgi:internalin A
MIESELFQLIERAAREKWTDLDLAGKNLAMLPPKIGQLNNLRELHLSRNQLTTLPSEIGQLSNLRELGVGSNRLTALPAEIGQLHNLEELYLDWNQLDSLPPQIGLLTNLIKLEVHVNRLTALPSEIGQLSNLRELGVGSNRLTALPAEIGQLHNLEELYLDNNRLTILPSAVLHLKSLRRLDLAKNGLAEIPKEIGQLSTLEMLGLANNQLAELPADIRGLAHLKDLYLDGNHLESLPESLRSLSSLQALYLQRNDALGLPEEVLQASTPREILEYYFRLRGGQRPLNEAKLILVGRGKAGKTSLVNRLVYDRFDPDEKKTEGIQITPWPIVLHGHEDVRLHIWDFGGQEIMHATHQFFLTQRSLYLLVLTGREGMADADAEYWLKLIDSFGGGSPVILVLNKIHEHPFDLNRRGLQQKYPIRDFVKTDCEDGTGIEALRRAIERETDRLEHLRDAFPASWFTIKDQLASMEKNYLSFEEYRHFCQEHGERELAAQEALAGYLHHLGIVLNYKEDPRLQDTHVLNPHWVTNGIYRILNSNTLEKQKGEIHLQDLADILDAEAYPLGMRRFLFDLMKKFELCFSFPDDEFHYLIPELLDKQEPEETATFEAAACLNFQYHYSVLPEGLLPRFIVRTHLLSESLPRWRTGVILKFESNRALVKADVQDKKVFISVSGPASGRRRLLAVIRSDFERIHGNIRNLQPQEMVPLPDYPDVVLLYRRLRAMEDRGIKKLQELVGDDVVELDVHDLLNGVDLEGVRGENRQAIRLFISYAHEDDSLREELQTHLKLLQRQNIIAAWDDRRIDPGQEWKHDINENLERADVIVLLVSASFIDSDYGYEKEMKRALERHKNREARVIPVIVRDVNWRKAPFAELQALPKDGKAITLWEDRDSAWRNVSEELEKVIEEIRRQKTGLRHNSI